jgi:sec-independent protein translocase protein TatB
MFDFDTGKLVVLGIVALAVIPPKDLPRVLRTVGKYVGQMRRMAADFQGQFAEAIKEAELDSVRKELDEIKNSAKVDTSFDPASLMRDNMQKAVEGPSAYETVKVEPPAPPAEPVAVEAIPAPEKATSQST